MLQLTGFSRWLKWTFRGPKKIPEQIWLSNILNSFKWFVVHRESCWVVLFVWKSEFVEIPHNEEISRVGICFLSDQRIIQSSFYMTLFRAKNSQIARKNKNASRIKMHSTQVNNRSSQQDNCHILEDWEGQGKKQTDAK